MGSEYLVNISVYAVAGLKVPGDAAGMPNPYVEVECLGEKRTTQVISGASACTFNNFYNFSKHMSEDDFTGGDAVVAAYHQKNSFGFKVKLGQVTFSLEKVYNQDGHLVPKDWFVIVLPDDPGKGCGYVELSLGAYAPGDIVPQSVSGGADVDEAAEVQSIKTRVVKLPTKDAAKSLFQLTVCIYQAEQLAMIKGMMGSSCNPFVQVDFNGTSQRTQTQRNNNPTWNEEVQVPFSMPAWDNSVNVTVFHDGGLTGSKVELGDVTLDIDNLAEEALEPSWFYFYKAPDGKKEEKSEFAGRMLVSASMERTEKPILTINPGSIANPPKVTAGVAWIDLYMACFDSTEQPEQLYVQIELPRIIDAEVLSSQPEPEGHGFVWKGKEIRLDHMVPTFSLPAPENCGEFIISVYAKFKKKGLLGGKKPERYMYARVPAEEVCKWDQTPRWRDMRMVVHGGEDVGSAGFLLLTLCLGSESLKPTRLKPMKIKWRDYCFRVKIYQAVNLPAKDEEGSSDPLVALNFGPAILRTQIITQCINPSWNQVLEENIKLPDDITLRPDVLITLLDSDEGSFEPMVQMRYKASEPEALPQEWKKSPRWFQLEPVPGGVPTQGKLLAAFELIPDVQAGPPRRLDAKTRKCRVDFFAIGARLRHDSGIDALNPILEVAWGRKEDNRATPKKCKHTGEAKRVVFNRFNWLQTVSLKVKLAEDDMFQEYLELKLLNETPNPKGDSEWQPVAHAAVHLTPQIPWVDPDRREKLAQQFSFRRQEEESNEDEDDVLNQEEEEQVLNPKSGWARLKGKFKQMREGESYELMCKKMGWDVDSIEDSNARVLGFKEYAVLDDETEQKNAEFLKNQLFDLEDAEESEWNATLLQFNRGFTWPQRSIASSGIDKHADYAAPLEENLEMEKTDYSSAMLFLGSEWGEPRNLGTLKYCVRIVELDKDDKEKDSPHAVMSQEEWDGLLNRIQERFEKSKDLVVRAYVLSGDGLRPPSGSSDCNSYVWSRIDAGGSEQNPVYNLKDNLTVRKHTLHPQFNKCHAFGSVRFPDHCVMTLSLVEVTSARFGSGASETVIGSTEIDLEDRWFNSHYQEMVTTDEVPIESRHLQTSGSVFSKGHIRLWLDIMYNQRQACPAPDAFAQERPIESLPSTDPLPFELRVAVFKVVDIQPPEGNSEPSVKASGKMTLDDGKDLFEETDTHFGCDDGTATLNWRLVFKNVMIPCKQPRLTVQIWNDNMLASDEVLAEVTLDFSKDFLIARKNNSTVDFPKGSLYMYHPAFPGEVRGVIDLEAILLPADEVRERPAGVGRDEPNQDPFLDPNDPHLVAHRSRIANLKIVKSAKALAGGLLAGAQLLLMLKLIAMGASGIFAAIMSILMVTK